MRNGRSSTSSSRAREWSTAGSSRCESTSVSPWPGKCLAQAATPPSCSPRQGHAEPARPARDRRRTSDRRSRGSAGSCRRRRPARNRDECHRRGARSASADPTRRARPRRRAARRARSGRPERPRLPQPRHPARPPGRPPRAAGATCPASRATSCSSRTSSASCSGAGHVAREEATMPDAELPQQRLDVGRGGVPSKPIVEPLADPTDERPSSAAELLRPPRSRACRRPPCHRRRGGEHRLHHLAHVLGRARAGLGHRLLAPPPRSRRRPPRPASRSRAPRSPPAPRSPSSGSTALHVLLDRVLPLLDQPLQHLHRLGVVERTALLDLPVLEGGLRHAQRTQRRRLTGFHRRREVLTDPFRECHGLEDTAPWLPAGR